MLQIEIIDTEPEFQALADDWRELAHRIPTAHLTQGYDWNKLGWEHRVAAAGDTLRCVTLRADSRLMAVWPFIQRGAGKLKRVDPLSSGLGEEYAEPLLDPAIDTVESCILMLEALTRDVDIIHVHFLGETSNMKKALEAMTGLRLAVPIDSLQIDRREAPSWDAFMSAYPSKLRVNLRGRRKRATQQAELSFSLADNPADQAQLIDWILRQKQAWLQRRDKSRAWFYRRESRAFLIDAATIENASGRMALFSLKLGGTPIAAAITTVDRSRMEMHVTSFDPQYSTFAPGMLLIQDMARWGFERDLTFDMRPLRTDYKERWANRDSRRFSFFVARSPRGILSFCPTFIKTRALMRIEETVPPQHLDHLKTVAKRVLRVFGRGQNAGPVENS